MFKMVDKLVVFTVFLRCAFADEIGFPNNYYAEARTCLPNVDPDDVITNAYKFECASACTQNPPCKSFSIDGDTVGTCYLNKVALVESGCLDNSYHFNKLELPCLNGGLYSKDDDACSCFHGYVGDRCDRLMQDCADGFESGHYTGQNGMYFIHPISSSNPIRVRCQMEFGGRTHIIRQDPDRPYVNFTRTWQDYKNGFGDMEIDGNFYIGNDVIHTITSGRDQVLLFDAVFDDIAVNDYRQIFYTRFQVANESENYRLSFSNTWVDSNHPLDNCFPNSSSIEFSTIDRDNDAASGSCAQSHLSGWWFDDCGPCNPLGEVQDKSEIMQSLDPRLLRLAVSTNFAVRRLSIYLVYWN